MVAGLYPFIQLWFLCTRGRGVVEREQRVCYGVAVGVFVVCTVGVGDDGVAVLLLMTVRILLALMRFSFIGTEDPVI